MTRLLLATENTGKIKEIQELLKDIDVEIITPSEDFDVEETGSTFEENSKLKAKAFSERFGGVLALADDSGLEVNALDGRPGVYSKRYGNDDLDRNTKLLNELKDVSDKRRTARFVCVMTLYGNGIDKSFRGVVEGKIASEMNGDQGFGYDPVFIPEGYEQTFAQLGSQVKHQLSHRALAIKQVKTFLLTLLPQQE